MGLRETGKIMTVWQDDHIVNRVQRIVTRPITELCRAISPKPSHSEAPPFIKPELLENDGTK